MDAIYVSHNFTVGELLTPRRVRSYFSLYFVKYTPHQKVFQVGAVSFEGIHISFHV
jgi:hypothetical protein